MAVAGSFEAVTVSVATFAVVGSIVAVASDAVVATSGGVAVERSSLVSRILP